jgi:hypothetical protein
MEDPVLGRHTVKKSIFPKGRFASDNCTVSKLDSYQS